MIACRGKSAPVECLLTISTKTGKSKLAPRPGLGHVAVMKKFSLCLGLILCAYNPWHAAAQSQKPPPASEKSPLIKNVEADEAAALLKENKNVIVLDVRTSKEHAAGHIPEAKNIDFYGKEFQEQLEKLDKTQTYLVHCASGGRSAKTRDLMQKLQFKSIYHLEGGFKAWEKAGKPVTR